MVLLWIARSRLAETCDDAMKYFNDCTAALAAGFSQKFLSSQSYHPDDSLPDYLGTTGVLLSMCEGPCDSDEFRMDHLSGSWLQNSTIGMHVFGPGGGQEGVGIILDPHAVSVQCVYPLDGATAGRELAGCGPMPGFDSQEIGWKERLQIRLWVHWRKATKFGFSKKWDDIPCSEFFSDAMDDDFGSPVLMDHNSTWSLSMYMYIQFLENQVMGHELCYNDLKPNFDNRDTMLLYVGPEPWMPAEWQDCTNTMQAIIQEHPKSRGIWNEVVMDKPDDIGDAVQAVFYINPRNREQAYFEAERLGRKSVLQLDPFDFAHLFQCPLEEDKSVVSPTEKLDSVM